MSRLRIVHTSTFRYDEPVVASYNEARMTPLTRTGQTVLSTRLDIHPCTWQSSFRDYWGTAVTAFEVLTPHQSLVITAEHLVQVDEPTPSRAAADWDELRSPALRDRLAEHLADTESTQPPEEVVELAREVADGLEPDAAAEAVGNALRERMEYIPGITTVHTPAAEAWAVRKGVCQDITHLALGALHAVGIPARYVSGYLDPRTEVVVGEPVTGESHAWLEYWAGGWRPLDPTNLRPVGEHHVVLARGRSYEDVPPLRGIYAGATSSQDLRVTVEITPEA
jgi:transglutaminase-like putative cysteine protease